MDTNNQTYFAMVRRQLGAEFWANNPSGPEMEFAIQHGAVGIASNPIYIAALLKSEPEFVRSITERVAADMPDGADDACAMAIIRKTVARPVNLMLPMYALSGGKFGHVAVQGNPRHNHDLDAILNEAESLHELGENIVIKLPATPAGAAAMEELTARGWPTIGTMSFSVAQYILMADAHRRGLARTSKRPLCFITMLPGLLDETLAEDADRRGIAVAPNVLSLAGISTARAAYRVFRDRGYEARILSGGARTVMHWTEVVGPEMGITLGGSLALSVSRQMPPIVSRIEAYSPDAAIAELRRTFPVFVAACDAAALAPEEIQSYAPVVRFQNSFLAGFNVIVDQVKSARMAAGSRARRGGRQ